VNAISKLGGQSKLVLPVTSVDRPGRTNFAIVASCYQEYRRAGERIRKCLGTGCSGYNKLYVTLDCTSGHIILLIDRSMRFSGIVYVTGHTSGMILLRADLHVTPPGSITRFMTRLRSKPHADKSRFSFSTSCSPVKEASRAFSRDNGRLCAWSSREDMDVTLVRRIP